MKCTVSSTGLQTFTKKQPNHDKRKTTMVRVHYSPPSCDAELLPVPVSLTEMKLALGKPGASVTFGFLADTYVKTVLKAGCAYHRTDVVFDRGETIKGTTRKRRSKTTRPIRRLVEGRDVPIANNLANVLKLADNKADIAHLLSD